jgi:hypothetical protein
VKNGTSGSLGTTGYGVCILDASRHVTVSENQFENCRHGVTGGGSPVSIWVRVVGNRASNMIDFAFDCHEETWWWTFEANHVTGGNGGFTIRGQACTVRGNWIVRAGAHAIRVGNIDVNTDGCIGALVTDNVAIDCYGSGVMWEGTADCRNKGGLIANNRFVRCRLSNITVWLSDNLTIGDNEYDGTYGSTGGDGNNIRLVGSSSVSRCTNISIKGGTFRGSEYRWVRADYTDGLSISNPYIATVGATTTMLTSCTNTRVSGVTGPAAPATSQTLATNANFSLIPLVAPELTIHTGTLTANRTVTLSTTNAYTGARFKIVRTGGGAFTLNVGTGPLKALATGTWGEFLYDGTAWVLVGYGAL